MREPKSVDEVFRLLQRNKITCEEATEELRYLRETKTLWFAVKNWIARRLGKNNASFTRS